MGDTHDFFLFGRNRGDKLYDEKDDDFLAQSKTFTQQLDEQHTRSMTPETLNRVREREEQIKQAKTEEDRQAAKEDKAFYRLSLVFHGDGAEMVKSVLGKEPRSTHYGAVSCGMR